MDKHWLDYLTAFGSVATPILVLFLAGVGWRIRTQLERRHALEDRLREDRIQTYNDILEPFIILLTTEAAWATDPKQKGKDRTTVAAQKLLSLEYRQKGFKLSLVGSDPVVKAYNDLMQFFYSHSGVAEGSKLDHREMMALLGKFLLEIRRSMGNEATTLDNWGMLEWFMTDARKLRSGPAA